MTTNDHFGNSGPSEVSENGPNEFPMPKNLGIDTKTKSLACSEPKFPIWPFYLILTDPKMATNGHFGNSGQSEVSENGPNEFPIPKNLGIDTKIKSLACPEPNLSIWPFYLILTDPKMAILATQANLRCLKTVPMHFPCPKT